MEFRPIKGIGQKDAWGRTRFAEKTKKTENPVSRMAGQLPLEDLKHPAPATLGALADLIWPPSCPLCNQSPPAVKSTRSEFCKRCVIDLSATEQVTRHACRRCGMPPAESVYGPKNDKSQPNSAAGNCVQNMLGVTEIHSNRSERPQDKLVAQTRANLRPHVKRISRKTPFNCFYCQKQKFEPAAIWPLWLHEDRVRDAVLTAKQAHQTALAATLGRRLATRVLELEEAPARFDFVTYVPSHITRQLVRGGNGNQILAAEVGKTLGVPCRNPLKITRRIAKQAWLGDQARIQNVRGAFSVKKSYAWGRCGKLAGSRVLLVDDVMTTGATANEISRILLAAGVKTVHLAVVARAVPFSGVLPQRPIA